MYIQKLQDQKDTIELDLVAPHVKYKGKGKQICMSSKWDWSKTAKAKYREPVFKKKKNDKGNKGRNPVLSQHSSLILPGDYWKK